MTIASMDQQSGEDDTNDMRDEAGALIAKAAPAIDTDGDGDGNDDENETSSAWRQRRRQDQLLSSEEQALLRKLKLDFSSSPPSRRIAVGGSRDKLPPPRTTTTTTTALPSPSTDSTHKHHDHGHPPRRTTQLSSSSVYHGTTLILLTLLLTIATHRYTFSSLRYKLNYFGTYQMRGVPTFHRPDRPAPRSHGESSSLSAPRDDVRGGSYDDNSANKNGHPQDPPLMMPREFANRRGDRFSIPRGVPLPPPLLALVNVKVCGAALSEGECRRVGGSGSGGTFPSANGSGGGNDIQPYIGNSSSLECSWCPNNEGSCVPKDMRGVMCGS
eukprot:CAMPEP_0172310234 /NCGR_PEP_ID=MMETSP1058-20130122/11364_1 /TAXON_ID=83371 /ORGANISM="Detonula confervacea, Strain CCMP 353" /LENGTH=327 /DNA_ID=CAMNT_0013023007 /DNA_START=20 /DNA_END=1003 /DNA_ORIENTATION=+